MPLIATAPDYGLAGKTLGCVKLYAARMNRARDSGKTLRSVRRTDNSFNGLQPMRLSMPGGGTGQISTTHFYSLVRKVTAKAGPSQTGSLT